MKKLAKIILILTIILLIIFLIPELKISGKTIENHFSYTKAICDESNYCEDYSIECTENQPTKLTPTGFFIQQDENWIDIREQKGLCE